MAPFHGAPPMALLTVGAGALLVGHDVIGTAAALHVDAVLWTLGTAGGLATAVGVPALMFTRRQLRLEMTSATWLMPVVPPIVSAATGAALIDHVPAGQARLDMLLACYALLGVGLLAALVVIVLVWVRLTYHKVGPRALAPTLFIVLGPLGQSVAAANLLGSVAPGVTTHPYGSALEALGVVYGVPVWGFAMVWLAIAAVIVLRERIPLHLSWWSFTFPIGTFVIGTSELALHTGSHALSGIAAALFALLVAGWFAAAGGTAVGRLL
jgi:tellurite resistance protein TehA-like permease